MIRVKLTWRRIELRWNRLVESGEWWKAFYIEGECLVCRRPIYGKRADNHTEIDLWSINNYPGGMWIHADMSEPMTVKNKEAFLNHGATRRRWWHSVIPRRYWRYSRW